MRPIAVFLATFTCGGLASASPPPDTQTITVTTRPEFRVRGSTKVLIFEYATYRFEVDWDAGPGYRLISPISLDTGFAYTFTVLELSTPDGTWGLIRRIDSATHAIYEFNKCEVHGATMMYRRVPLIDGEPPILTLDAVLEERQEYPHATHPMYTGCSSSGDEPDSVQLLVCDKCDERKQEH